MELIRTYTKRVSRYLPASERDKVEQTLFQQLLDEYGRSEWKEEAGGERFFLQHQPHPIRKATELSEPSHLMLIGPTYYLSFIEALKLAALILAVIWTGLFAFAAWNSDSLWRTSLAVWLQYPDTLLKVYLAITLVFVALEKAGRPAGWLAKWNPMSLHEEINGQRVSLVEALVEINLSILGLLLLSGALNFTTGFADFFAEREIWVLQAHLAFAGPLFWMLILLLGLDLLLGVAKLMLHHWNDALRITSVVVNLIWIGTLAVLVAQDALITLSPRSPISDVTGIVNGINVGIDMGIIAVMIVVAAETMSHLRQLSREHPLHWQHV